MVGPSLGIRVVPALCLPTEFLPRDDLEVHLPHAMGESKAKTSAVAGLN